MVSPQLSVVQLEDEIVGRVIHSVDLFEDDLSFEGQIRRAQHRLKDQIRENIRRLRQMLVENLRLIGRVLSRGVGIERPTENFQCQRQLFCATSAGALEHHVFEHVRDAHLLGALVERCCAHPRPQCNRPYSRHVFREYGQPVRQNGTAQFRFGGLRSEGHSRERPPFLPRPPRDRRGLSPRSPRSELSACSSPSPPLPAVSAPTAASAAVSPLPSSRRPLPAASPSGFDTSAFIDRRKRPRSSRSSSLTFTRSPFFTTSSVFSVRPCFSSEICTSPSVPGMISTKAPNAVVLFTVPS